MSQVTITKACIRCEQTHTIQMPEKDYQRWKNGEHIQYVAPYLSADDRELLISGICGPCFDDIFAGEDEDE